MDKRTAKDLLETAREHANNGLLKQASNIIEEVKHLAINDINTIIEAALCYHDIDLIERSVETLKTAINDNPDYPLLYIELGKYQKQLGKYQDATNSFNKALDLDPRNPSIHIEYANMLTRTGNVSGAIESYAKALHYNPADKGSWTALASLRQLQGDIKGCKDAYKALHQLDDKAAYITLNLVSVLGRLGEYGEAEVTLREAIEKDVKNIEFHFKFVEILLTSGNHKKALSANERALSIFPDKDELRIQRANILERMGEFDDAFNVIKGLIENRSVRLEAALTFAKISPHLDMTNEAKKLIAFIIERDSLSPPPNNVKQALEWLTQVEKTI